MNGIDRNVLFRELISQLLRQGAELELFNNERQISVEFLDNWLHTMKEIEQEIIENMDIELNE